MSEEPKELTIGDVCDVIRPKKSKESHPVLTFKGLHADGSLHLAEDEQGQFAIANNGDIVFTKQGHIAGWAMKKIGIVTNPNPVHVAGTLQVIRPRPGLYSRYLYYWLRRQETYEYVLRELAGRAGITDSVLRAIPIVVVSTRQQEKIVRLLDEAFEGIAIAKANAEKNLENARALFDSHLQNVFTQGGASWKATSLQELFAIGSSKRVLKSDWKTMGVPFYRGREITKLAAEGVVDNELFISETHFSQLEERFGAPTQGDVMITAIGTIGNVYIVRESDRFYFKDASVLWMKKASEVDSSWIKFWLSSQLFLDQLDRGNGATVDTLTVGKLRNMTVLVPPLAEQRQIASLLDDLQVTTDDLARICAVKQALLEDLKESLLHQAFSGNLEAA